MKASDLSSQSVEGLIEGYVQLSVEQGDAIHRMRPVSLVNRLGRKIHEISKELERRPGECWQALRVLFDHPNAQVRFNAATSLMSVSREEARRQMQAIADSTVHPQAIHAKLYLSSLDGELSELLRR